MESTAFSSLLIASAITTNGTMTKSSTPARGGAFRYVSLVAEFVVQRLALGLAAGKQTSRILSRNRSEQYSNIHHARSLVRHCLSVDSRCLRKEGGHLSRTAWPSWAAWPCRAPRWNGHSFRRWRMSPDLHGCVRG